MRRPRLLGSSSRKPTGAQAELAVARDLAQHQPPAVAGADDQHAALALAPAAERRQRAALVDAARERAHADRNTSASSANSTITPLGSTTARWPPPWCRAPCSAAPGAAPRSPTTVSSTITTHRPHHRLVVALAGVAPAALVDAREHEHRQAAREHPPDRAFAQLRRSGRRAVVEAQLEREVVRERDQRPVDRELGQRVAVQRKGRRADPSAHCRDCKGHGD